MVDFVSKSTFQESIYEQSNKLSYFLFHLRLGAKATLCGRHCN
jgi:hypothetical protein